MFLMKILIIFKLSVFHPNVLLICAAVVVDFCATMSAANAQKEA